MLRDNGCAELKRYDDRTFKKEILKISDTCYFFKGFGHSNSTLFIGDEGCVLADALDSDERAKRLLEEIKKITPKPVQAVVFTHSHPDHTGGSGALRGLNCHVLAHRPVSRPLGSSDMVSDILLERSFCQFGRGLTGRELVSRALGPREGRFIGDGKYDILPVTHYITRAVKDIQLCGMDFRLYSAPGETDDTMYIYSPKEDVLCTGDNFYPCFPNLYALRGGAYRDISKWIESLSLILDINPKAVLPGHGYELKGENIKNTITPYRRAIKYVLDETLQGINRGKSIDRLAARIKLPENLAKLPFLGEYYGAVEWSVKSIYTGYIGWFDGNPTNIHSLSPLREAEKMIKLAGGRESVVKNIGNSVDEKDYLWAMKLCDVLLVTDKDDRFAKRIKARCCLALREMETSANGRHYYQTRAKKLSE